MQVMTINVSRICCFQLTEIPGLIWLKEQKWESEVSFPSTAPLMCLSFQTELYILIYSLQAFLKDPAVEWLKSF